MNYQIFKPFCPFIYKSSISDHELLLVNKISNQTKEIKFDIGNTLAGNLSKQYAAEFKDNDGEEFSNLLNRHVFNYADNLGVDKENFFTSNNAQTVSCSLGNGPWINYQYAGEFNPAHSHTGNISVVIYIDVPECIAEENVNPINSTNRPSAGKIEFIHGTDGLGHRSIFSMQPSTGDIIIFPAYLKHLVYPFKSNVERISMSFNIHNLKII